MPKKLRLCHKKRKGHKKVPTPSLEQVDLVKQPDSGHTEVLIGATTGPPLDTLV